MSIEAIGLTKTERIVYALVVEGLSNADIGRQLGFQDTNVKFHLTNIMRKLFVKSRAQLIVEHYRKELRDLRVRTIERPHEAPGAPLPTGGREC